MDLNGKARREGSSRKQTSLTLLCETSCFEFPHAKWISQKVGFKTYWWTPAKRASQRKELETCLAVGEWSFKKSARKWIPYVSQHLEACHQREHGKGRRIAKVYCERGIAFSCYPYPSPAHSSQPSTPTPKLWRSQLQSKWGEGVKKLTAALSLPISCAHLRP